MSNLRLINETVINTPINTLQITDIFSSDFNTYCIEVVGISCESSLDNNSATIQLLDASGSTIFDTNQMFEYDFFRGFDSTPLEIGGTGRDEFGLIYYDDDADNAFTNMTMWIFNPFDTDKYTFHISELSGVMRRPSDDHVAMFAKGMGVHQSQETITGLSFINRDSLNIATGTFRTYGLRRDDS